jgi:hypothetical protein
MENRFRPLGIEGMAFALREVMSIWSDKWRDRDGEAESMGRDHENGHQLCAGGGQVGRGANCQVQRYTGGPKPPRHTQRESRLVEVQTGQAAAQLQRKEGRTTEFNQYREPF